MDCWSVGARNNFTDPGSPQRTASLIENWNGRRWAIVPSPNTPDSADQSPNSIACISASDCWAVGDKTLNDSTSVTAIDHWDGTMWSAVTSPSTPTPSNDYLVGVSCTGPRNCWAVGQASSQSAGSHYENLVEHWDGSAWSLMPVPDPGTDNTLLAVTCVTYRDCWAVGRFGFSSTAGEALHWDGVSWSETVSPSGDSPDAYLDGISCSSRNECMTVGSLTEQWNGSSWTLVPHSGDLNDVACPGPYSCWAVGAGTGPALIEHWNGSAWALARSPAPAAGAEILSAITCPDRRTCWAVGQNFVRGPGDEYHASTLVEHGLAATRRF